MVTEFYQSAADYIIVGAKNNNNINNKVNCSAQIWDINKSCMATRNNSAHFKHEWAQACFKQAILFHTYFQIGIDQVSWQQRGMWPA